MEEVILRPFPSELFFDLMPPQSPPFYQFPSLNLTTSTIGTTTITTTTTTTITQQIFANLSEIMTNSNLTDIDDSLVRYKTIYRNYHGIISSFVCVFGLTCNLFNIIVLTRPLMRSSTNTILTSLALSDLIKMLFVLPAAILFYCLQTTDHKSEPDFTSRFQVTFYMVQMLVALSLHCISTWLTVLLAGFRYVFLSCKSLTGYVSTPDRALIGVSTVVILSTLLCIPSYIEHRIVEEYVNQSDTKSTKFYRYEQTNISRDLSLRDTVFVLHGVIFKLIPCILLILFSCALIQQLRNALAKAEKVQKHAAQRSGTIINSRRLPGRRRDKENRRTTLMLVIVCALFLLTELPQGAILLLTFLSKTNAKHYYQIYQQLGDTFDILALINNSVNFILYCFMSRAFRDTFRQTFCFACHKIERRESTVSLTQFSTTKKRSQQVNLSIAAYDNVPSRRNSIEPKVTFNHSTTVPLLSTMQINGFEKKKNSCSS